MSEAIIVIWVILVGVVALNGFAAGIAAVLHARRKSMRQGGRVLAAVLAAGLLPAQFLIVVPLAEGGSGEEPLIWMLTFGATLAVGAILSLPGAILVARKLEAPGDDYRAFE